MNIQAGGYAWEKFHVAMTTLAEGTERIQQRLADAYCHALIRLQDQNLSPENRDLLRDLNEAMGRVKDPVRGNAVASAAAMTDDEAREFAKRICEEALRLHGEWAVECAKQDARRR